MEFNDANNICLYIQKLYIQNKKDIKKRLELELQPKYYNEEYLNAIIRKAIINEKKFNIESPFMKLTPNPSQFGLDSNTYFPLLHHHEITNEKREIWSKKVKEISKVPQNEQRSKEWFAQRKKCITASDLATVLGESKYNLPEEVILKKCDRGEKFTGNKFTHHGTMYEPVATEVYEIMYNVKVVEFGLIPHGVIPSHSSEKLDIIAASPDGITENGVMLEIKCPYTRKPVRYNPEIHGKTNGDGDIVPHYYYMQMQSQLECCDLDICDFLECKFYEFKTDDDFYKDSSKIKKESSFKTENGLLKGIIIRYKNLEDENSFEYHYPPNLFMSKKEQKKWITKTLKKQNKQEVFVFDKVVYWYLENIFVFRVYRDRPMFESKIPKLKKFWNRVIEAQNNEHILDEIEEYVSKNKKVFKPRVKITDKIENICLFDSDSD